MAHPYWPLFDLRVRTPRLELRYPDDEIASELAALAADGIHPSDQMPFSEPWTRTPPGELETKCLQHWWGRRAAFTADDWVINLAVLEGGRLVGVQDLFATKFPTRRTVDTGSWLGIEYHRRGIGTEMRSAVLHLAFAGLRAEQAETGAFTDNPASQRVTAKLGYEPNGRSVYARDSQAATVLKFVLTRTVWEQRRRDDITMEGLDACLPLLGLTPTVNRTETGTA